jgi:hypothetical protein
MIPYVAKPLGFEKVYQESLSVLRELDKESLEEFMRKDDTLVRLGWRLE